MRRDRDTSTGTAHTPDALQGIGRRLGHEFKNLDLLSLALTHTSARVKRLDDYERLEFLGDRVLGLIIAEALLKRYPKEPEGDLAKRLAQLVRKESLAVVAERLELGSFIRLSRSESESGGRKNPNLLADVCEALIAALYLDGGLHAAQRFVLPYWEPLMDDSKRPPRDPKTSLQEWAQGHGFSLPQYQLVRQSGPAHDPVFTVAVQAGKYPAQEGKGRSKRQAEQLAAEAMMRLIFHKEKKRKH